MRNRAGSKIFYGYIVVMAGVVASVFIVGTFTAFAIFFKPLSSEFGWTRAMTSMAMSLASLVMGSTSILSGRFTDRYGPKVVLIASGLLIGAGNLLMSQANALWQLYLFYGVFIGAGMSASEIPIVVTVARWFVKRRGTFTGIAKVGAGVGMMLIPLLASWLILNYEWRNAYVILGVLALVGIVSMGLLFRRDPAEIGEMPDGVAIVTDSVPVITTRQFSLKQAMATRQFWMFSMAWFSFIFVMQMTMVHIANHITDLAISPTIAATVISVIGAFSILGRMGLASLSDGLGTKKTYLIAFSMLAMAMVWIQFADSPWMFYLFAAIYGTAHGASFALLSPMTAGLFGVKSLGSILGMILFIGNFGSLISPTLAGQVFDMLGNYRPVFFTGLALSLVAFTLILLLKPIQRGSEAHEEELVTAGQVTAPQIYKIRK